MPIPPSLRVLIIASEAEPFVKVGGLADVAGSLPRALKEINLVDGKAGKIDVRLVIPYHPHIRLEGFAAHYATEYPIRAIDGEIQAKLFSLEADGLPVYLVAGEPIDQETGIYSANLEDDGYKYVFFSLACLELIDRTGWRPDVLHANDWHTAAAVYSLALHRDHNPTLASIASLLTVHNLPYLGSMTPPAMEAFGLPVADSSDLPAWATQMALPLGLLSADAIVTVSPGYAREILTEEFGSGLAVFLRAHAGKISGILNGLDTRKWDAATDIHLAKNFSTDTLELRSANKSFLQQEIGFEVNPQVPLLAMVTRMDPQKGVDLAVDALRFLLMSRAPAHPPLQMVFLGTGNPVLENVVMRLEQDYPTSVRASIEFNEPFSRHIYAGADMLLMPSRYEPCGLSQMIAMHYGCAPIASATGGLCDTIQDPIESRQSTGFLFTPARPAELAATILRAITLYQQNPAEWQAMQLRGMQQDFSWKRSAGEYLKLYQSLIRRRKLV